MATYRITGPDGVTVPDNLTGEQLIEFIKANYGAEPEPLREKTSQLMAIAMGAGGGFGQLALGAQHHAGKAVKSMGDRFAPPRTLSSLITNEVPMNPVQKAGKWIMDDAQRGRDKLSEGLAPYKEDHPWSTSGGELTGNVIAAMLLSRLVGGSIAGGGGAMGLSRVAAPLGESVATAGMRVGKALTEAKGAANVAKRLAMRAVGGGISGGVTAGTLDPESAGVGAGIGALLPIGFAGLGGLAGLTAKKVFHPEASASELARRALALGAPIGIADLSNNSVVRGVRSILNNSLFTGGIGRAQNEAKQGWFNQMVGKTFGTDATRLTPEVMDAAKNRLGSEFDRIWGNNNLVIDEQLLSKLSVLRKNADLLPPGEGKRMLSHLDDLEGRIVQGTDGGMVIPGDVANRFQSSLRQTSEGAEGYLKNDLVDLRQSVIGAFNRSVSPQDVAALTENRVRHKAMKMVEQLLQKTGNSVPEHIPGDVSPALLSQAVSSSSKGGMTGSPLTEVAQIGQRFFVDSMPQTGARGSAAVQDLVIGAGAVTNPYTLLGVPAAMGLNKALGSPAIARNLMNIPNAGAQTGSLVAPVIGRGLLDFGVQTLPLLSPRLSTFQE